MTKQCRFTLKAIKQLTNLTNNSSEEFKFDHSKNRIYLIRRPNTILDLQKYHGELCSSVDALIEDGFIVSSQFGLRLTHKGLHPYRVSFETAKQFFLKSILVPIAVSLATTLITLAIEQLL